MRKQHARFAAVAVTVVGSMILVPSHAQAGLTYITDFAKNDNMQATLQANFPSGLFAPVNGLAGKFNITTDANGNNFEVLGGAGSFTVAIGVAGVTDVYTLMTAYAPGNGATLATVEFIGSAGADQTFTLINGVDTRDFYQGGFANTLNGTTSQNAFTIFGQGGGGGGGAHGGFVGTYVMDEQHFALNAAFANQTLTSMVYTYTGGGGTPLVQGITVATPDATAVPEPASFAMMGIGAVVALGVAVRRSQIISRT